MSAYFLGIDVGRQRIGLATSESGIVAEPVGSFEYRERADAVQRLESEITQRSVTTVVVGVPIRADGSVSEQAEFNQRLVDELARQLPDVTMHTVDEALTSKEAERLGGRNGDHDALAAALILEQYFREQSSRNSSLVIHD